MPLTDAQIRSLKPKDRVFRKSDEKGLYLEVTPGGSRLWRLKYRVFGKEKRLALGAYPTVKLGRARDLRDAARVQIAAGIDPCLERKLEKARAKVASGSTFAQIAEEYIGQMQRKGRADGTILKARFFLSKLESAIGAMPISEVDPQMLLSALRRLEGRGNYETAKKTRSFASRVFRFAVMTGRQTADPASILQGALVSKPARHYAAILEPALVGELLRAIDDYDGHPVTKIALQILPHVFVRPGELRMAEWSEFDLHAAIWTIPARRTKMRKAHRVPLSGDVIDSLRNLSRLTGPAGYAFPAVHSDRKPMSENTLNAALRRMGFGKDEVCAHGFRSTASTLLHECGQWSSEAIERSLGHAPRDAVRAAYDRGERWEERVRMTDWWSAFLERVKHASVRSSEVSAINCTRRFAGHPQRIGQAEINTDSRE